MVRPLEQIEPLTRGETQMLIESLMQRSIQGALIIACNPGSAEQQWGELQVVAASEMPLGHLLERLPGDYAFVLGSIFSNLFMFADLNHPEVLLNTAVAYEQRAQRLPADLEFMAAVEMRIAVILRAQYYKQQVTLDDLDALTRMKL